MKYLTIKYCILICLLLINIEHLYSQITSPVDTIVKNIYIKDPSSNCISISNPTGSLAVFSFSINNKLWADTSEMLNEIRYLSGYNSDSLYYYAWKYVCNNTYSNISLTNNNWITSPILYLNSIGFGLCGKQALVLANIWKKLGYKSRIWGLNGHIVPEVFYNGNWHMLDPAYKVYYLNKNNIITNVQELSNNPLLISNPINVQKNDLYYFLRYTNDLAKLYISKDDNSIIYEDYITDVVSKFVIELPQNSTFDFPINDNSNSTNIKQIPYKAFCKITIPANWKGNLNNNLILAGINGKGKVLINKNEYIINSTELNNLISNSEFFISQFKIIESKEPIEIIYFINPIITELKNNNIIRIIGINTKKLKITNKNIPDSISVVKALHKKYFFYENSRVNLLNKKLYSNIPCLNNNKLYSKENFIKILKDYYQCTNAANITEINEIINKVERAFKRLQGNYNYDKLFFILNNMPNEILFYDFKNASEEELLSILLFINKKE